MIEFKRLYEWRKHQFEDPGDGFKLCVACGRPYGQNHLPPGLKPTVAIRPRGPALCMEMECLYRRIERLLARLDRDIWHRMIGEVLADHYRRKKLESSGGV